MDNVEKTIIEENDAQLFSTEGIALQELEERKELVRILEFDVNKGEYNWFPDC